MLESITIAYLNYELFRRRQERLKRLVDFLLIQPATGATLVLTLCYIVGTSIENSDKLLVLSIATFMFFFLNWYMIAGALTTNQVKKLARNIMNLLLVGSELSMHDLIQIRLWRSQLLSEHEAVRMYAPSIVELSISYDKLITLNAYLVGLWLVLLNSGGYYSYQDSLLSFLVP